MMTSRRRADFSGLTPLASLVLGLTAPALASGEPGETSDVVEERTAGVPALVIFSPPDITLDASVFPAGGVITGVCHHCETTEDVTFSNFERAAVTGTFTWDDDWRFVFVPDQPLEVDSYIATVAGGAMSPVSFQVLAGDGQPPQVDGQFGLYEEALGEAITCVETTAVVTSAFYEQATTGVFVQLSVSGLAATQYDYQLLIDDEATGEPFGERVMGDRFDAFTKRELGDEDREVCVGLEAMSRVDGTTEIIYDQCVETSSLGDLGAHDQLSANVDTALGTCTIPPAGYDEQWCEVFASAFEEHSCDGFAVDPCRAARGACPDGDFPEYEDVADGSDAGDETGTGTTAGCSIANSPGGRTSAWAWLAACGLLAGTWRRRQAG